MVPNSMLRFLPDQVYREQNNRVAGMWWGTNAISPETPSVGVNGKVF
jgi:hypothetical protein